MVDNWLIFRIDFFEFVIPYQLILENASINVVEEAFSNLELTRFLQEWKN